MEQDERQVRVVPRPASRWYRLRWLRRPITWIAGVLAVLVTFALVFGGQATVVTEDDALAAFRAEQDAATPDAAPEQEASPTTPAIVPAPEVATGAPASADDPTDARADASEPPTTDTADSTTPDAPDETPAHAATPEPRPSAGVYAYAVTGSESLDVFGADRTYPDRATATVTHEDGCVWRWRAVLVEEHVDDVVLCTTPHGEVHEEWFGQTIEFLNVTEERVLVCSPPVLVAGPTLMAGGTSTGRCRDDDDDMTADVSVTETGRGSRDVGGAEVDAVRVRMVLDLSGSSDGRSTIDVWSDAMTGLLLEVQRQTDTMVDTQLGRRRYRESLTMTLLDATPRT